MNALALQTRGDSPIASLESKTDTATATAPNSTHLSGSAVTLTGQYIFDRFVENDDEEVTKMGLIRAWVKQYTTDDVKKAIAGAVELAKAKGEAQLKTMRNHQTVMRLAFGSWKYAEAELRELGVTEKTGYQLMRVLGKKALEKKGIKWDGSPAKPATPADVRARQKLEKEALENVKIANPQNIGESLKDYTQRTLDLIDAEIERLVAEQHESVIQGLAEKFHELAGSQDTLREVFERLLTTDFEIVETDETATM